MRTCWIITGYIHTWAYFEIFLTLLLCEVPRTHAPGIVCSIHTRARMDIIPSKYIYLHAVLRGDVQEISVLQRVCKNNCGGCDLAASTGPWTSKPFNCSLKLEKSPVVIGNDSTWVFFFVRSLWVFFPKCKFSRINWDISALLNQETWTLWLMAFSVFVSMLHLLPDDL